MKLTITLLLQLAVLSACAGPQLQGPQLQIPRASSQDVDAERRRQLGLIQDKQDVDFRTRIEEWRRVFAVYSRLRTAGAELCKADVKPFWEMWLADQSLFPVEERNRAKRFLGVDQKVSVLAVSGRAASAGLRPGDLVSKIDGVILEPQSSMSQGAYLQRARQALAKAGMRSVEIEISRPDGKYSVFLTPEIACRYPLTIVPDAEIDARATGDAIVINSGILTLASSDDELAHVIGHELAHNALGHERKQANKSIGGFLGAVADIGVVHGALSKLGGDTGRKAFSQDFEREADYMSLYFMARAGFDASKAADTLRKFGVDTPGRLYANYASTHPSTPERAANLEVALREVTGKIASNESLVPTKLQNATAQEPVVAVNALKILDQGVKTEREPGTQPATVSTFRPVGGEVKAQPARHHALLTHIKGRLISPPPMTLDAEYFDNGSGAGTSRLIFPGNQIWEGEFKLLPLQESFKGLVTASLLDPDEFVPSRNSSQKGFAQYSEQNGTKIECSFTLSDTGRIDQGRCLDNRGNEYRITN